MRRIALIALLALAVGAQAATPGRTDGPEGSEYGKGGYHYKAQYGRFYTEGFLGAAMMESEAEDTETNLITGLNAGYMVEEWASVRRPSSPLTRGGSSLRMTRQKWASCAAKGSASSGSCCSWSSGCSQPALSAEG